MTELCRILSLVICEQDFSLFLPFVLKDKQSWHHFYDVVKQREVGISSLIVRRNKLCTVAVLLTRGVLVPLLEAGVFYWEE